MAATRSNSSTESADARAASHTAAVAARPPPANPHSGASRPGRSRWSARTAPAPWHRPPPASVQAAMTPTASADPSVRANERAACTAPTSTSLSRTPTDDTVTRAERRDGSRSFAPLSVRPAAPAVERHQFLAGPEQQQVRPGAAEDDPTVAVEHTVGQRQRAPQPEPRPPGSRRRDRGGSRHAARRCRTGRSRRRRAPWGGTAPAPPGAPARRARRRARSGRHRRPRAPRAGGCRASRDRPSPASRRAELRCPPPAGPGWRRQGAVGREHATNGGPQLLVLLGDCDRHSCPLLHAACPDRSAPPGRTTLLNAAPPTPGPRTVGSVA